MQYRTCKYNFQAEGMLILKYDHALTVRNLKYSYILCVTSKINKREQLPSYQT